MRAAGSSEQLLKGKTALVLGAGGVGKAIAYGLTRRGVNVVVADGVARQALTLAAHLDCRAVEWSARHTVSADLLFNCTPVGMHPNVDETPFERHYLRPSMIVFDAVYNPENTLLVKEARGRNCTVVTGVDMFVRQACLQFKLFTGQEGPADLMRRNDPPGHRRGKILSLRKVQNVLLALRVRPGVGWKTYSSRSA